MSDPIAQRERDPGSNAQRHAARGVFVGREDELETLRSAFEDAVAGRGSVVMLAGEAGIGKTRTAQEFGAYASLHGAEVLWGKTHESSGAPPFWPWVEVGRNYAARHDIQKLPAELAPSRGELARLFPELRRHPEYVEPQAIGDPKVALFQLFDAYTSLMRGIAGRDPTVVVLEDLHWADRPTLKLLQHLARELASMRLLVVGTYRHDEFDRTHPLSETLAELNREGTLERITLRGLSEQEVASYIGEVRETEPSSNLISQIHGQTDGNPFFLAQMVNLMAAEGTLDRDTLTDIRLPEGVREVLGRRLDRLSEEANDLLKVAAVVGREFAYETLSLATEHDDDALLRLIEEGLDGRVIEETERPGEYQFTHALMQETLLEELSTTRRVRLHGRIGEALEQQYGDRLDGQATELARHFVERAALNGEHADKALQYSRAAGEEALERLAWSEAAAHFNTALEQAERLGNVAPLDEAVLHEGLGRAGLSGAREADAVHSLRRALEIYTTGGDAQGSFRIARTIGIFVGLGSTTIDALISAALDLQDECCAERGQLEVFLAGRAGRTGHDEEAQSRIERAFSIADAIGDDSLKLLALTNRAALDGIYGRDAVASQVRAAEIAEELDGSAQASMAHTFAAQGLLWGHLRMDDALPHTVKARKAAEETRQTDLIVTAASSQVTQLLFSGRLSEREPFERIESVHGKYVSAWFSAYYLGLFVGDDEIVARTLRLAERDETHFFATEASAANIFATWWWETGDAHALKEATERAQQFEGRKVRPPGALHNISPALGLLSIASGKPERMEAWHDQRLPATSYPFMGFTSTEQVMGLVDEELGRDEEALTHYLEAVEMARLSPTLWAMPAYERARLLLKLGRPDAAVAVEEVLEVTTRIGMNRWRDKALRLRDQLRGVTAGTSARGVSTADTSLSPRELEVLSLLATGAINREIGTRLQIRPATVARHVSNILSKLDVANRTEAAAYAFNKGLAGRPTDDGSSPAT